MIDKTKVWNSDCMIAMKEFPNRFFDLAIIDPPYGLGENGGDVSRHHTQKKYSMKAWDNDTPPAEYFTELFRISRNQIIWGANHFISKIGRDSSCWVFWNKDRYGTLRMANLPGPLLVRRSGIISLPGMDFEKSCHVPGFIRRKNQYHYINGC